MNILERLANAAKQRVETQKEKFSLEQIKAVAFDAEKGDFDFENALKKPGLSFICECKKASPSKGIIAEYFPYTEIARDYETAGADAISVLTEPTEFLGENRYLEEISRSVDLPCLRKDFIVDEYMIYEAKTLGAKAYLLIVSLLSDEELTRFIKIGDDLGISALVETRTEEEIKRALKAGARIIGVNNRNLEDFSVDMERGKSLRELVPPDILFVAESGVKTAADIEAVRNMGADAVLIGETMMKAEDKSAKLEELKGTLLPAASRLSLL